MKRSSLLRLQAAYYIASGAWPLLSRASFEAITGPKKEWWLVQMVALLAVTNGTAIAVGSCSKKADRETTTLSLLSALSFAVIDTIYVLKRRIPPVYLGDAALELSLIGLLSNTK
jgi:hypothetical protein